MVRFWRLHVISSGYTGSLPSLLNGEIWKKIICRFCWQQHGLPLVVDEMNPTESWLNARKLVKVPNDECKFWGDFRAKFWRRDSETLLCKLVDLFIKWRVQSNKLKEVIFYINSFSKSTNLQRRYFWTFLEHFVDSQYHANIDIRFESGDAVLFSRSVLRLLHSSLTHIFKCWATKMWSI